MERMDKKMVKRPYKSQVNRIRRRGRTKMRWDARRGMVKRAWSCMKVKGKHGDRADWCDVV